MVLSPSLLSSVMPPPSTAASLPTPLPRTILMSSTFTVAVASVVLVPLIIRLPDTVRS